MADAIITADPSATVTLPGGQTIAPNQVNTGTRDVPNIIATSGPSRTATNQSSAALSNALGMFNIGNGNPQAPNTAPGTPAPITPATPGGTPSAAGTTTGETAPADPYIAQLQSMSASSNNSTKMLIQNILDTKQQQTSSVDRQYAAYKQGLQLLGIQHNAAQSTPDLLMGQVNAAEDTHQQKLQAVQSNIAKALATAQQAQENNDFKTLNAQMAYVKEQNAEKVAALKAYQTGFSTQPKIAANVAHSVYATMQTLDPADQEAFIQQVSQQYGLPLGTLVTALTDEHAKQDTASTKAESAQATLDAKGILSPAEAKTLGVKYGTTKADAAKMGIVPTTKSTARNGGAGALTKAQIAAGESRLQSSKGTDGYVDPFTYQQAYDSWTKNGGTTAKFISAFPPKDYVNPAATNLPKYLMPAKAKSAASGRTS